MSLNDEIFHRISSVPHNIVMDLNNVMKEAILMLRYFVMLMNRRRHMGGSIMDMRALHIGNSLPSCLQLHRVEAPITEQLRDFAPNREKYKAV